MESNPYEKNSPNSKVELYKQKLKERNNNQNWILSNYFGKPGGGAPLRDKNGNAVTKMRSIADDNIYLLDSREFTKGQENDQSKFSQTFNTRPNYQKLIPVSESYQNEIKQNNENSVLSQSMKLNSNANLNNNYFNYDRNPDLYLQQFKQNPYFPPFPYPYPPPYMIPYPYFYPPMFPYPSQPSGFNKTLSSIQSNNYPKSTNSSIDFSQDNHPNNKKPTSLQSSVNSDDGYCLPVPKEEKSSDKERQKEQWKNELLQQIEEKKRKDEEEKRKNEEMDRLEEEKYQEYLKIKKEQAEEQEKKRKNKLNKKLKELNALNESGELNQITNSIQANPTQTNHQPTTNDQQVSEQNYMNDNPDISPEEIKNQEEFKRIIDNQYKTLDDMLTNELEKEKQNFYEEYESRYSKPTKELLALAEKEPVPLIKARNYSEKRLKQIQDMIEQRNLIDYIFDKPTNQTPAIPDLKVLENSPSPSYFGYNREEPETKFSSLHSCSTFVSPSYNGQGYNFV